MTELRNDRMTGQKDRQGKSSIAPTFSKRGYKYKISEIKITRKYPNLQYSVTLQSFVYLQFYLYLQYAYNSCLGKSKKFAKIRN